MADGELLVYWKQSCVKVVLDTTNVVMYLSGSYVGMVWTHIPYVAMCGNFMSGKQKKTFFTYFRI